MAASFRPSNEDNVDDGIVAEINITPLTDVFLVLLVIFMVTTSVVANQSKQIDLPGAEVSDTTPQGVTVTVNEEGTILVNDTPATVEGLFEALVATGAGLAVAIIALMFFNYLQTRVGAIAAVYSRSCERFVQALLFVETSSDGTEEVGDGNLVPAG